MPAREWAVIDSNVLIAANGKSDQADDACIDKCIDILMGVSSSTSLALDDGNEILSEYSRYCDYSGKPGVGDLFFAWAVNNQYTMCHRVSLTPDQDRGYAEFPESPDLAKFDPSDRKFVATALRADPAARIYNAVDSDWRQFAQPLASAGIRVTELCPDCLKPGVRRPALRFPVEASGLILQSHLVTAHAGTG